MSEVKDSIKISHVDLIARGERLRQLRKAMKLNIRQFAELCQAAESTVRQWEKARANGLTQRGINLIMSYIRDSEISCTAEWLLHGGITGAPEKKSTSIINVPPLLESKNQNEPSPPSPVPIASITQLPSQSSTSLDLKAEIEAFMAQYPDAVILRVQDDGMAPFFSVGDYVGGFRALKTDWDSLINEICIVQTFDGYMLARKLNQSPLPDKYRICAINTMSTSSALVEEVEIMSAAKILRCWRCG